MTMLDRMRRHQGWLKWSLGLVVLTFVFFYVPDFLSPPAGTGATSDAVATVQGRAITVSDFTRAYNAQMAQFRNAYGGNMSPAMLRQLGMDRQVLQQMIDQEAVLAEATRLGISATDAEVRDRIVSIPAFQENGQFIGEQRYRQLLRLQRPPITAAQFEDEIRNSVILDKMRATLTEWITVSDADADAEYRRRNEKVSLELVSFPTVSFLDQVQVTDADVAAYFEQSKDTYRIGERRKVRYLLLDVQAIRNNITVPEQDIQRAYRQNIDQYSQPEQVRVSHILLNTEGKDEAAVRARAEDLLKQIKGGADFEALAKANSQDPASASKGGDLDFFGRGRMVPEFEAVAFTLPVGQLSDVVRTQYGFHIMKVTDKKAAEVQPLDAVRPADHRAAEVRTRTDARAGPRDGDHHGTEGAGRSRQGRRQARPEGAGVAVLHAQRADPRTRRLARGLRAGLHARRRQGQRAVADRHRRRVPDRHRQRGGARAHPRRGEGTGDDRPEAEEGTGRGADPGAGKRHDPEGVGRLCCARPRRRD